MFPTTNKNEKRPSYLPYAPHPCNRKIPPKQPIDPFLAHVRDHHVQPKQGYRADLMGREHGSLCRDASHDHSRSGITMRRSRTCGLECLPPPPHRHHGGGSVSGYLACVNWTFKENRARVKRGTGEVQGVPATNRMHHSKWRRTRERVVRRRRR